MLSQRLQLIRRARGLSLEGLAVRMGGMVTKQALSKYETGKSLPSSVVLTKIAAALDIKTAWLFAEPSYRIEFVAYRKRPSMSNSEQQHIESLVTHTLEQRIHLQQLVGQMPTTLPVHGLPINTLEDSERVAQRLREDWNLGTAPIADMTALLESHAIHVIEIEADDTFDGISAIAYDDEGVAKTAAVVTQRDRSGERQRFNLAHELGHLVLDVTSSADVEKVAHRFAAAFLAPADVVRREVGTKRTSIGINEFLVLKQRFGMSIQALLRRLRDLDIITESYYRWWCIEINREGWRKQEPDPLPLEQGQWLRLHVLRSLSEGLISSGDAETILGEPVVLRTSLSLAQRRAFMKLPLDARRRVLEQQAHASTADYAPEPDWQAGDFIDE